MCSAASWRWVLPQGAGGNGWPHATAWKPEWRELLADLDRLQEIEAEQDGKCFILRHRR